MKILNLYAGIGGNRKLWGNDHEITAVEYNQEIAMIYQDLYPNDNVLVLDAHEFLLHHYKEFDFIWSSPPCPTHSKMRLTNTGEGARKSPASYPSMKLYEEIIFLQYFYKGKFVIENVNPYYEPLINPTVILQRHLFWANFTIVPSRDINEYPVEINKSKVKNDDFDLTDYNIKHRKDQIIRNLVNPDLGLYIFEQAQNIIRKSKTKQYDLF